MEDSHGEKRSAGRSRGSNTSRNTHVAAIRLANEELKNGVHDERLKAGLLKQLKKTKSLHCAKIVRQLRNAREQLETCKEDELQRKMQFNKNISACEKDLALLKDMDGTDNVLHAGWQDCTAEFARLSRAQQHQHDSPSQAALPSNEAIAALPRVLQHLVRDKRVTAYAEQQWKLLVRKLRKGREMKQKADRKAQQRARAKQSATHNDNSDSEIDTEAATQQQQQQQQQQSKKQHAKVPLGTRLDCVVCGVEPIGLFVLYFVKDDTEARKAFCHRSEISNEFVTEEAIQKEFHVGQRVQAVVIKNSDKGGKISVSIKQCVLSETARQKYPPFKLMELSWREKKEMNAPQEDIIMTSLRSSSSSSMAALPRDMSVQRRREKLTLTSAITYLRHMYGKSNAKNRLGQRNRKELFKNLLDTPIKQTNDENGDNPRRDSNSRRQPANNHAAVAAVNGDADEFGRKKRAPSSSSASSSSAFDRPPATTTVTLGGRPRQSHAGHSEQKKQKNASASSSSSFQSQKRTMSQRSSNGRNSRDADPRKKKVQKTDAKKELGKFASVVLGDKKKKQRQQQQNNNNAMMTHPSWVAKQKQAAAKPAGKKVKL